MTFKTLVFTTRLFFSPRRITQWTLIFLFGWATAYTVDVATRSAPISYQTMREFNTAVVRGGRIKLFFKDFHATRVCPAFVNVYLWSIEPSPWGGMAKMFIPIERSSAQLAVTDPGDIGMSLNVPSNIEAKQYFVRINRQDNCSWLPFSTPMISKSPDRVVTIDNPNASSEANIVASPAVRAPVTLTPEGK